MAGGDVVVAPGVYDGLSACLAARAALPRSMPPGRDARTWAIPISASSA